MKSIKLEDSKITVKMCITKEYYRKMLCDKDIMLTENQQHENSDQIW